MTLAEIRQRKAAKVAEQRALIDNATKESRNLTTDEASKFDALKAEITELEQAEQRQSWVDDQERRAAGVTVTTGQGDTFASLEQRFNLSAALNAASEGRALSGAEAEMQAELRQRHGAPQHGGILVPASAFGEKRANTTTSAGSLVPTDHRADLYIGALRNSLVVKKLGARIIDGLTGNVAIPKAGNEPPAGWIAEGGNAPEGDATFASVTLTPKHVAAVTEVSKQLLQQSSPAADDLLREALGASIAKAVDSAAIFGSGVGAIPRGVALQVGVQTTLFPAGWAQLLAIEQQLAAVNVEPTGWYASTGAMTMLRGILRNASAGAECIATRDKIGDLPAASTNQATGNYAILGDWQQLLIGEWQATEVLVNPYAEGPYRRGGVLIRVWHTCDIAVRYPQAFVVASTP